MRERISGLSSSFFVLRPTFILEGLPIFITTIIGQSAIRGHFRKNATSFPFDLLKCTPQTHKRDSIYDIDHKNCYEVAHIVSTVVVFC